MTLRTVLLGSLLSTSLAFVACGDTESVEDQSDRGNTQRSTRPSWVEPGAQADLPLLPPAQPDAGADMLPDAAATLDAAVDAASGEDASTDAAADAAPDAAQNP